MISVNYLKSFCLEEQDLINVRFLGEKMLGDLPAVLDKFYKWMEEIPEYTILLGGEEHIKHVKAMQLRHWTIFFSANVDENYINFRKKVGATHARIGLSLDTYYRSMVVFGELFIELFKKYNLEDFSLLNSFQKLINLDTAIVVETYNSDIFTTQNEALNAMSTPVAMLWDNILFLPLVGVVDSKRSDDIMTTMLQKVAATQAKVFILDISGVAVVDTAVANHFIKITKATKLMGCKTILSGISPAVAQTIVELGIQIEEITTTNTMKAALNRSFELANLKLTSINDIDEDYQLKSLLV